MRGSSPLVRGSGHRLWSNQASIRFIPARAGIGRRFSSAPGVGAVHPRSCGDRDTPPSREKGQGGSSPLVRGSVTPANPDRAKNRFIPARAGIGRPATSASPLRPVHPRSCGDRTSLSSGSRSNIGSSPLVRGSVLPPFDGLNRTRFIPARAGIGQVIEAEHLDPTGSSPLVRGSVLRQLHRLFRSRFIPARAGIGFTQLSISGGSAVHPRSCGDRFLFSQDPTPNYGSSPLVRGSVAAATFKALVKRFIPARAGIGRRAACPKGLHPVHPRSCGDRGTPDTWILRGNGSSPLVRGSGPCIPSTRPLNRFIPARAGIGIFMYVHLNLRAVHPRSCGDRCGRGSPIDLLAGSSPLVRGSAARLAHLCCCRRFIPARAGIGYALSPRAKYLAVHPRSCGDRDKRGQLISNLGGSSPLVRGSGAFPRAAILSSRFIPARAGIGSSRYRNRIVSAVHPRSCGDRRLYAFQLQGTVGSSPLVRGSVEMSQETIKQTRFIPARAGIGVQKA